jgi:hypothetical protein
MALLRYTINLSHWILSSDIFSTVVRAGVVWSTVKEPLEVLNVS